MLHFLFGISCSYYSPPILEVKDISIPEAQYAYSLKTNQLIQEVKVTPEKVEHWVNKNCYPRGNVNYHPITGEMIREDIEKKELPPRFFAPLTIVVKKDQLFVGEEDVTEKEWKEKTITVSKEERKKKILENHSFLRAEALSDSTLPELYSKVSNIVYTHTYFVEQCSPYYQIEPSKMALLVVEPDVAQWQLKRVLYSLISAGVDTAAFYVDDPNPLKKREANRVGGVVDELSLKEVKECPNCMFKVSTYSAEFDVNPKEFVWKDSKQKEKKISTETGLSKYLGEEFPPKVKLQIGEDSPVSTLFQYQDALAGAEVYCTGWELTKEREKDWEVSVEKGQPKTLGIQREKEIPVHIVELFETGDEVYQRQDGVYCFRSNTNRNLKPNDSIYGSHRLLEALTPLEYPPVPILPEPEE